MMKKIKEILKRTFPRLLLTYRLIKSEFMSVKPMMLNPIGFKFSGNVPMASGNYEPGETKVFINILPKVDVVINVGANIGYYCCIALSQGKKVVAFEPIPTNIKGLLRNIKANNWETNIEIFPIALGNRVGIINIYGGDTGASLIKGWAGVYDLDSSLVPCSTLDTVLGKRFSGKNCLLMVDIEGAEKSMLEGASSFLNMNPKPIWFVEISISANQPDGIKINPDLLTTFEIFWSKGYEAWTTHKQKRLVSRNEVQKIMDGGADTLFGDTFLFIDKDIHGEFDF